MADDKKVSKVEPKVEPKAEPKAEPKIQHIRAVYGRMVDPLNGIEYLNTPSKLLDRTSWVEAQLGSKKLELCDPQELPEQQD